MWVCVGVCVSACMHVCVCVVGYMEVENSTVIVLDDNMDKQCKTRTSAGLQDKRSNDRSSTNG